MLGMCSKPPSESFQQTQHCSVFSHFTAKSAGHADCFGTGFYDVRNALTDRKTRPSATGTQSVLNISL